jgi:aminoglycoside phosphotransferase (APT) family kinase protein
MISALQVSAAAAHFIDTNQAYTISPVDGGLINDSWRLKCESGSYLLQRLNRAVFPQPNLVMQNLERVSRHLQEKARERSLDHWQRHVLCLVPDSADNPCFIDSAGDWWRMFLFIENSHALERIGRLQQAHSAAFEFGRFLRDLSDLPPPILAETIPDFHNTPARLAQLESAAKADSMGRAGECGEALDRILSHKGLSLLIEQAQLPIQSVHNDTKLNNILFDNATGQALCVVDLDTVMPGIALHDFGDMVRSAAGSHQEEGIDLDIFQALSQGWLNGRDGGMEAIEGELLHLAPQVITLELAARFLADHLQGDHYFKTTHPGENLQRSRRQLKLLTAMQRAERQMQRITRDALAS